MPALTVKELGTKGATSTSFDTVLMCVDRHLGYIAAVPTMKQGFTGQQAANLVYRICLQCSVPPMNSSPTKAAPS